MTRLHTRRSKLIALALMIVLSVVAEGTPTGQRIVVGGFINFTEITEKIVCFPNWFVNHPRCFSLDRFDPTCPQCI
jgi:hypothetical protein